MFFKVQEFVLDDDNDKCLLFSFNSRKSMKAYKDKTVLFYIYPNPDEAFIDCYRYVKEYYDLLEHLKMNPQPDDYIFTANSKDSFIILNKPCTTAFLRGILQDLVVAIGKTKTMYANHSLRYGGARHRFIFSMYKYNLDQVRYVAGWTKTDSKDTLGKYLLKQIDFDKERQYSKVMKHSMEGVQLNERLKWHSKIIKQMNQKIDDLKESIDVIKPHVVSLDSRVTEVEKSISIQTPQPMIHSAASIPIVDSVLMRIEVIPAFPTAYCVLDCIDQYKIAKNWPHEHQYHRQNKTKFIQRRYIGLLYDRYTRQYTEIVSVGSLYSTCVDLGFSLNLNGKNKGKLLFLQKYGTEKVRDARSRCKKHADDPL